MLNELLPNLQERVKSWASQLKKDRWISPDDLEQLISIDSRSASSLFDIKERPLVVGFFGGTGVGKSSLLNRLAGEKIARTGVERPTSREVTIFLHQSISISQLPEALPTDKVKVVLHKNEKNQDLLWIDMPDFDSAESSNQALVLKWLPYIDVLVYVVNPERYKDDKGWQMLREYGLSHAWLFVINHWDRGDDIQYDDFHRLLAHAEFTNPLIYRTNCSPEPTENISDDFNKLQSTIQNLANENVINHLEQRGIHLQIQALRSRTKNIISKIGSTNSINELAEKWQEIWEISSHDIIISQKFRIAELSEKFANSDTRWFRNAIKTIRGKDDEIKQLPITRSPTNPEELWDKQIQTITTDSLEQLIQNAKLKRITTAPLKKILEPLREEHKIIYALNLQQSLHHSLAVPGSYWHRLLHRLVRLATTVLPIAAMFWVAYKVIVGFYQGSVNTHEYLGFNFAIHSALLIGLAWLIPYFLLQKSKPSLKEAAITGMQKASKLTLSEFDSRVLESLEMLKKKQRSAIASSEDLFSDSALPDRYSKSSKKKILSRMLIQMDKD